MKGKKVLKFNCILMVKYFKVPPFNEPSVAPLTCVKTFINNITLFDNILDLDFF